MALVGALLGLVLDPLPVAIVCGALVGRARACGR